jgi:hypothetical protein
MSNAATAAIASLPDSTKVLFKTSTYPRTVEFVCNEAEAVVELVPVEFYAVELV